MHAYMHVFITVHAYGDRGAKPGMKSQTESDALVEIVSQVFEDLYKIPPAEFAESAIECCLVRLHSFHHLHPQSLVHLHVCSHPDGLCLVIESMAFPDLILIAL